MATTLTFTVTDLESEPLAFPATCVGCGGMPSTESILSFAKVVTNVRGTQAPVHVKIPVPHCGSCARSTKAVFLARLVPFALGFLAAGGTAFAVVAFNASVAGLDDIGRLNNANSLVLGAAAGLGAGLVGAFVCELAVRMLLLPILGTALWRAPLFVPSLLTDVDHVAGLTGRPNAALDAVTLTFARDVVGRAVAAANGARLLS